jgi:uncharacterized protein YbjQ (UPF0145 family)
MSYFDREGRGSAGASVVGGAFGEIPAVAESRLRSVAVGGAPFTSTLSVSEFALLRAAGPVPVAQVLGASVYNVGWQYLPSEAQWGGEVFCELDIVSHAWEEARRHAFSRLTDEAALVGAHAVVGVRLRRGEHDWARGSVDYVVSGTAVRYGEQRPGATPVLSDLSVQEFWKLRDAGWGPAGLVAAASVFFISQSRSAKWRRRATFTTNQELEEFSRGFSAARERAISYLRGQARAARADGIVGVTLDHSISRARIRVAIPTVRPTGAGVSTIAIGGGYQAATGQNKRDGIVVTVQAVGTAIRREAPRGEGKRKAVFRLGG